MKKKEEFKGANPYETDKLAKIPSWIKILLLKYWAAAAAFFFFGNANPLVNPDSANSPNQYYIWISFGLALLLEYIVKNLVRLMRNSRDDTYKQYIINKKGVLSLFLHIIYGFVIMFPMYGTLYFLAYHHLIINLFALPEVPAIEPITAGFVFIFYDGIAVLIKNLIIKGIKKYKFYKQEKKAQAIISAANIKKEEEDNDEC